ncbi:hypothetical protein CSA08_00340 [Candidatus Gracilibacteria bacterium]|nr:MAG: hypothetical protein CSA08_00340 [Candidatus Gracilibacteria bacterium]
MLSKNKLFDFFTISLLLGVFINNLLISYLSSLMVLLIGIILFFNLYIYIKKYFLFIIIVSIGFIIGITLSFFSLDKINEKEKILDKYIFNKNDTNFEILELHKVKDFEKEYIAKVKKINDKHINKNIYSIIIVPFNFDLNKGDIIKTKVKIYKFKDFGHFEYKNYMLSKNIYFKSYVNSFERAGKKEVNLLTKWTLETRQKILSIIKEIYPKQEAIFLGGILIGARENIPKELKTNFNNSGLTHFIAVSGFNITILIIFLGFILKYFPFIIRIIAITIFISFFTFLVGDNAPVIRASIMGLVGYYIVISGRKTNNLSIILFTAMIMTIISPLAINYDISLHLSFLAVLGIIYTQNFFGKIFYFLPSTFAIKEAFVLTLASLSFTLPMMIFNFGQISLLSPIANIAITWSIPIAMLLGFLSIILYMILPGLGIFIGFFDWILLKYDMFIVNFFGELDFALLKFDFGPLSSYFEVLYLLILIFIIMYFNIDNKKNLENN